MRLGLCASATDWMSKRHVLICARDPSSGDAVWLGVSLSAVITIAGKRKPSGLQMKSAK